LLGRTKVKDKCPNLNAPHELLTQVCEGYKYNRINARKLELENLPSNLAEYNTSKEVDIIDDQLKIKALIEYKSLCLLNKQKALRQELVSRRASMPSEPEIRAANNEAGPRFGPWLSALSRPPCRRACSVFAALQCLLGNSH
jgi:hypothetical protein